jgi:hypothetical protein
LHEHRRIGELGTGRREPAWSLTIYTKQIGAPQCTSQSGQVEDDIHALDRWPQRFRIGHVTPDKLRTA